MIIADDIKPKAIFAARKHVSHLHKTCVKPSCAVFTSQVTTELCRLAAESLIPDGVCVHRVIRCSYRISLPATVQQQLFIKLL